MLTECSRLAEATYRKTLQELHACLTNGEREQLQQSRTVSDIFAVLNKACLGLHSEKGMKVAKAIDHYSKCIDIICQSHPEYAALVWGSLKLLLQVVRI